MSERRCVKCGGVLTKGRLTEHFNAETCFIVMEARFDKLSELAITVVTNWTLDHTVHKDAMDALSDFLKKTNP